MEWRTKAWGGGDVEFKVVPSIVTVSVDLCSYPKFLHKKFVNSPSLYYGYSAPRHHHIDDRTENNCIMLLMAYHFTASNSSPFHQTTYSSMVHIYRCSHIYYFEALLYGQLFFFISSNHIFINGPYLSYWCTCAEGEPSILTI
jgi:hypothetical protein